MLRDKIFLTGFMGSGKSTVGRKLATILKRNFYDLDEEIEKSENLSISRIFATKGEEFFREKEKICLKNLIKKAEPFVLSLGGGTLGDAETTAMIKEAGLLIFIDLPVAALVSRLSNIKDERPLIKGLSGDELKKFIETKLQARILQYQQAHLTVNGLNLTAQELYKKIVGQPQENNV
jgi:shikimate kinase